MRPIRRLMNPIASLSRYAGRKRNSIAGMLVTAGLAATLALLLYPAPSPAAQPDPPTPQTNLADIEDEVMCPICGTTLGLSESPQAQREKDFIQRPVNEGRTKDEVKAALVAEYGRGSPGAPRRQRLRPRRLDRPRGGPDPRRDRNRDSAVRRWRRAGAASPQPENEISQADDERLSADLARYDP